MHLKAGAQPLYSALGFRHPYLVAWTDRLPGVFQGLAGLGVEESDSDDLRLDKAMLTLVTCLIAVMSFAWIGIYLAIGLPRSAAIPAVYPCAPDQPGLETARMVLRPLGLGDVDQLIELDSDPEVMTYLTGGKRSTRAEVTLAVQRALGYRWFATSRDSDEFVGWFGLWDRGRGEEVNRELGYRLARAWWGHGLATEGGRALIGHAFTNLNAHLVWAQTMAANVQSRRVMERLGLSYARTVHLDFDVPIPGTEQGEVIYELCRDDWCAT